MRKLGIMEHGRRRINSVFGEGSSPRTRQIREGLNLLGIHNDELLRQPNKKKVYVCELFPGARDDLLGWSEQKTKGQQAANVSQIANAWAMRWLFPLLKQDGVIEKLRSFNKEDIGESLKKRALKNRENYKVERNYPSI